MAILAEREDDGLGAARRRQIERDGIGAAEIGVGLVELAPVRRRKEIALVLRSVQIGCEATESVFPVATNSERPSLLIPPGAQMPPPRPRVTQLAIFRGSSSETPSTSP